MQESEAAALVVVHFVGREGSLYELGGRAGNVVTSSETARVLKGWRLLSIDDAECTASTPAQLEALLGAAQRRPRYCASFFTGSRTTSQRSRVQSSLPRN